MKKRRNKLKNGQERRKEQNGKNIKID